MSFKVININRLILVLSLKYLSLLNNTYCIKKNFYCIFQAGGGRNEVDPRFISLFSVFNITFPSEESLRKIYLSILSGHLQPFESEIRLLADTITTCTLELYKNVVRDLPPTPSKFHYIFNLRDLSRITHGLCLTTPDRFESVQKFVRVWRNECLRVFFDRLINAKDKELVQVFKERDFS